MREERGGTSRQGRRNLPQCMIEREKECEEENEYIWCRQCEQLMNERKRNIRYEREREGKKERGRKRQRERERKRERERGRDRLWAGVCV
jgi:hypothetical protein